MSKNKFEIHGDRISISHPDWDSIASASIRGDYAEELQSVTWSKKGDYLYSNKLEIYLHIYILGSDTGFPGCSGGQLQEDAGERGIQV